MVTPDITEIQDFKQVIQIVINGERPLIVGGHSVSVWATYYHSRLSKQLSEFFPFTTKDLDLYGSVKLLEVLHEKFGGSTPKIEPRTPVAGSMQVILDGKERRIEILRTVKGLDERDLKVTENITVLGMAVHVLAAHKVLKAKICNAATIDQANRSDVKHVKMMVPCLHEFLYDYIEGVRATNNGRPLINLMTEIRGILNDSHAVEVSQKWEIDFSKVWPMGALQAVDHPSVVNFLKYHSNS